MRRVKLVLPLTLLAALMVGVAGDGAAAAKKKKCKAGFVKVKVKGKKKCRPAPVTTPPIAVPVTPAPPAPLPPVLRASVTWDNATDTPTDVDLWIFDQTGNQDGGSGLGIPNSIGTTDNQSFGPETFSDLLNPSTRVFSYVICMANDGGTNDTVATLNHTLANGVAQQVVTGPVALEANGDSVEVIPPGGFDPFVPPVCNA